MDTDSQNINHTGEPEWKFENDKSSLEKLDCTYHFEISDSHIKMEMVDNIEYLGNEYSHSNNTDKSHQNSTTGLQTMSQRIKCKEEKFENMKSRFEIVEQMHCLGNTNSNSQSSENLHKNLDTELRNIKKEVEVKKDRSGSLHPYLENANKILIFENTDSSIPEGKDSKFVEMINIKREPKDPQYQISELENKNDTKDVEYVPSCEDTVLRTERINLSITADNSNLEAGSSNLENSDIGFEKRSIKVECSDLKTENGYIGSVHSSGDTMLTHLDVVPHVYTMMTDLSGTDTPRPACALPLLTPSEVTVNCHLGAVLTPSESHPHVVALLSKSVNKLDNFKCNFCDKEFNHESFLKRHMFNHSAERPYHCNLCDKRFWLRLDLRSHMISHSSDHPHQCNVCDKRFTLKYNLRRHVMWHSNERPHKCNVCDKGFKTVSDLRRHMIIHSAVTVRRHHCNVCEKKFRTLDGLRAHIITHSTERPHQCNLCNNRFKTLEVLKGHMIIHSTEQPHKCNMCDKRFKTVYILRKHIVTHSTDRPHQCKVCDKRFKTLNVLKRHVITHSTERPHLCNMCDKWFKTVSDLRRHMVTHTIERPHLCNMCDKGFKTVSDLRKHIVTHSQ